MEAENQSADKIISAFLEHVPESLKKDVELVFRKCKFDQVDDPIFAMSLHLLFMQLQFKENTQKLISASNEQQEFLKKLQCENGENEKGKLLWKKSLLLIVCLQILLLVYSVAAAIFHLQERTPFQTDTAHIQAMDEMEQMHFELKNKIESKNENRISLYEMQLYVWLPIASNLFSTILIIAWIHSQCKRRHLQENVENLNET